jgi:hypothetical protein
MSVVITTILFLSVAVSPITQGIISQKINPSISIGNTILVGGTDPRNYTNNQNVINFNSNFLIYNKKTAYGYNVYPYPEGPVKFQLDDPSNLTIYDYMHYPLLSGLTWTNDFRLIGCDYSSGYIYEIDPEDLVPCCIGGGGVGLIGLAFDPVSKRMYGSGQDGYLYEINSVNGEQSQIGPFGSGYFIMTGLAFDNAGVLFGWDVIKDSLWTINTENGTATMIGPLGIDLRHLQDGDFYRADNVLYLAAYIRRPSSGYYPYSCLFTCDTKTGNCTFIGQIEDNFHLSALAIPYGWDIPYADFTWSPVLPPPEKNIHFNASNSFDPDGHITLYEWDWDNDGDFDESKGDPFAEHSWDESGKYPITLKVTDNTGLNMSKTIRVLINRPPKTKIFGPRFVETLRTYTFGIKGIDSDGDDLIEYCIDWGDGSSPCKTSSYPSGTVVEFDHFWRENGTYTVKARVMDKYRISSDWATIKVFVPRNKVATNLWYDFISDRFPMLSNLFSFFDKIYN